MTATAFERITHALTAAGLTVRPRGSAHADAQCPAHDDRNPSLSITKTESGILVKCHAGCLTTEVLTALRLGQADLFDQKRSNPGGIRRTVTARYDYPDEAGTVVFTKLRYEPKSFSISPAGAVGKLATKPLYCLPAVLAAARAGGTVYVVEGEKDADALIGLGLTATCNYEGASTTEQATKWRSEYSDQLTGANVVIVADRDEPGRAHARAAALALVGHALSVRIVQARTGKDTSDHLAAGHGIAEFESLPEGDAQLPRVAPTGLAVIDWHEFWANVSDELQWVCEPLLERGRATAIYSAPKVGKSLLALEIAAALSCGRSVMGNPRRPPMTVLYVDLENAGADIKERLKAFGYGPDDLGRLRYLSFPSLAALDTPAGGRQCRELVEQHQAEVVVIDTVSRVISGPEDSSDTIGALYRNTIMPLKAIGVTVLRLDHSGKNVNSGQRGSNAKATDVDHVWQLATKKGTDRLTLRRDLDRNRHGADRLTLVRGQEPLRHDVEGTVVLHPGSRDIITQLDNLGVPLTTGRDACRAALVAVNVRVGNDLLSEAIRVRKQEAAVPGHQPLTTTDVGVDPCP